jgi:hypothetical protein
MVFLDTMQRKPNKPRAATPDTDEAPAPAAPTLPQLWTTEGLALAVGYHVESIRRAIRQGRIRTVRFGRFHRIPAAEAQRILSEGLPV